MAARLCMYTRRAFCETRPVVSLSTRLPAPCLAAIPHWSFVGSTRRCVVADPVPLPTPPTEPEPEALALALAAAELAHFEAILTQPSAPAMRQELLALNWGAFERFVRYLFEFAG